MTAAEYQAQLVDDRAARASKYKARKVTAFGRTFHSKKEAKRYGALLILQKDGTVGPIECQPRFRLEVNGVHIADYVADFRYRDLQTGEVIVEDVKGYETPEFKLKKRLMLACHGVEVRLT
jgi:hypothetical protein